MNTKLQQARLDRHWSATDTARRIGISRVTYARWENGEQLPHDSTLVMACRVFKMSPEALGFEAKKPQPTSSSSELLVLHTEGNSLAGDRGTNRSLTGDVHEMLRFIWHSHGCSFQELQMQVANEMDKFEQTTSASDYSRRDLLKFLAGLPIAMAGLTLTDRPGSAPFEDVLSLYTTGVPACWKLHFEGGWRQVREILPSYITQLTSIIQSEPKHQQAAASLLSQAHQLACLVTAEEENFGAALLHNKQAFTYGQLAEDPNLQAASLLRHIDLLFKRELPTIEVQRQAIQYADLVSPLLRSRLFADYGSCLADTNQRQEALRHVKAAQDIFPDDFAGDPGFAYTHTSRYILYLNEALAYLRLGNSQEAFLTISQAGAYVPEAASGRRMELAKYTVLASMAINDLEQTIAQGEMMSALARQHDSIYWNTQLLHLAQQIKKQWPNEKRARSLIETLTQTT